MRAVEHYIGRPLADERVRARGSITPSADELGGATAFELQLRVEAHDGAPLGRRLVDRDCTVLSDAAALTIAITIDPDAVERATGSRAVPQATPQAVPQAVPRAESEPRPVRRPDVERSDARRRTVAPRDRTPKRVRCAPSPASRVRTRVPCATLGLDTGIQAFTLPAVGPTLGGRIGVAWRRFALHLGATHMFRRRAEVQADPPKGGDLALTHASVGACARLGVWRIEFPLCADVDVVAFSGRGFGVTTASRARVPYAGARFGAGAIIAPVRRFATGIRVDATVPFAAYRFKIDGLGTVFRPTPAGLRAVFVLELRAP